MPTACRDPVDAWGHRPVSHPLTQSVRHCSKHKALIIEIIVETHRRLHQSAWRWNNKNNVREISIHTKPARQYACV